MCQLVQKPGHLLPGKSMKAPLQGQGGKVAGTQHRLVITYTNSKAMGRHGRQCGNYVNPGTTNPGRQGSTEREKAGQSQCGRNKGRKGGPGNERRHGEGKWRENGKLGRTR